jgi:hypothetical protein
MPRLGLAVVAAGLFLATITPAAASLTLDVPDPASALLLAGPAVALALRRRFARAISARRTPDAPLRATR